MPDYIMSKVLYIFIITIIPFAVQKDCLKYLSFENCCIMGDMPQIFVIPAMQYECSESNNCFS